MSQNALPKTATTGKAHKDDGRRYVFQCENDRECVKWVQFIKYAMSAGGIHPDAGRDAAFGVTPGIPVCGLGQVVDQLYSNAAQWVRRYKDIQIYVYKTRPTLSFYIWLVLQVCFFHFSFLFFGLLHLVNCQPLVVVPIIRHTRTLGSGGNFNHQVRLYKAVGSSKRRRLLARPFHGAYPLVLVHL